MILFPNCKINIGLRILSKRADGYHELETLMYPVRGLCDALEIIPGETEGVSFSASGLPVDAPLEKNLCIRAYEALRRRYPLGGVKIHLHKKVPMGAGLGGGSADAAYVIRGLSELFGLGLSMAQMERLASEVGSDVPFFIKNVPAIATGRGECLEEYPHLLGGYQLVLVKPEISVGTAEAYAGVAPYRSEIRLSEALVRCPIGEWKTGIVNDFEASVFARYPVIARIKADLYRLGADYASMSGSGSAVFGIFGREADIDLSCFSGMFVHREIL